jgi:hypothetical protein
VYAACSVCVVGLSWGDVDSCRDVPQYKVMKYLVFGIISSSLLLTRNQGSDKRSALISLKFEISRQRKVEGVQVKRAGTNGA